LQRDTTAAAAASEIEQDADRAIERLAGMKAEIGRVIFGQENVVEEVLIALLAGGHALLVGVPGLAKTRLAETLGTVLGLTEKRIQFTPDLMPADIIGSEVLEEDSGGRQHFRFIEGPIFTQLLMADEINRASPRTQAALLQAMQERKVTVAGHDHRLPAPFHVLATQNPIEQEGTYPLPEAQLDRFLMHVNVDYPDASAEMEILRLTRAEASHKNAPMPTPLRQETVFAARQDVLAMHMASAVEQYIVQLVIASRKPAAYSQQLAGWIEYGGSPRATIALDRCARAHAWLHGQDYVSPDDVQAVAADVLRHRLLLSFEAEANGVTPDQVIRELLALVPVG